MFGKKKEGASSLGVRDIPISKWDSDALGLGRYARALGDFILKCDTPITVGIQGDWGSGKTSIMNLIERHITSGDTVLTYSINTWQYAQLSGDGQLSLHMLQAMYMKLADDVEEVKKFWGNVWKKVSSIKKLEVTGIGSIEMGEEETVLAEPFEMEKLKSKFQDLVIRRLQQKPNLDRVVFFIDDLDRVLPERAVELLEVIKNFIDVPGCVFVIACDYEVVRRGLKTKFNVGEEDLSGRSFFDKIIQVPFRMPVHGYEVGAYIGKMLERIGWKYDADEDLDDYQMLLEYSIGFNPRSIKRLCNTLLLLKSVVEGGDEADANTLLRDSRRLKVLFGLVCLESQYEEIYGSLSRMEDEAEIEGLLLNTNEQLKESGIISEDDAEDESSFEGARQLLKVLGRIVDADGSGKIDSTELEVLQSMISLSAITSIRDESLSATAKPKTADALLGLAEQKGYVEIVARLREYFGRVPGLKENFRTTAFSYGINKKAIKIKKSGSVIILGINMDTDSGPLVSIHESRIWKVNNYSPRKEAFHELKSFAEQGGYRQLKDWIQVVIEDNDQLETFLGLVSKLRPFS